MPSQPMPHYRPVQRHLHWIIFALVLIAYVLINVHGFTAKGTRVHDIAKHAHMVVGVLVLLLVWPRLWARVRYGAPPLEPTLAWALGWMARVTHWALYAFLIVQPLLGLATEQVDGKGVTLFGVTLIPALLSHPDHALHKSIEHWHVWLGTVFYAVIGLHILAALWHHGLRRDDTLRRMLPPKGVADGGAADG